MKKDLHVNIPAMDAKHDEFLELLEKIQNASKDQFLPLFHEIIEHTKEHFAYEEVLMHKYEFYAKQEHIDEHTSLLAEMNYFYEKAQKMAMFGRSYIDEYAYEKFKRHILNIDSQLAMFFKENRIELDEI